MRLVEDVDVQLVGGVVVMDPDVIASNVVELVNVEMVVLVMEVVDQCGWKRILTHWLRPW